MSHSVDVISDVICPWCFIGKPDMVWTFSPTSTSWVAR